jgi:hypothetical protein
VIEFPEQLYGCLDGGFGLRYCDDAVGWRARLQRQANLAEERRPIVEDFNGPDFLDLRMGQRDFDLEASATSTDGASRFQVSSAGAFGVLDGCVNHSAYSPPVDCVILNACYTHPQGQLLAIGVSYTVAVEGPISDSGATEFTRGFYDAIGAGKGIEFAYQEGCRTMKLTGHQSSGIPVLLQK